MSPSMSSRKTIRRPRQPTKFTPIPRMTTPMNWARRSIQMRNPVPSAAVFCAAAIVMIPVVGCAPHDTPVTGNPLPSSYAPLAFETWFGGPGEPERRLHTIQFEKQWPSGNWTAARTIPDGSALVVSSPTCPAVTGVLDAFLAIAPPRTALPGYGDWALQHPPTRKDMPSYRITYGAIDQGRGPVYGTLSQPGDVYSLWADEAVRMLEPCWATASARSAAS